MEYKIISGASDEHVSKKVSDHLKKGWKLHGELVIQTKSGYAGSITHYGSSGSTIFAQVIIKE